MLNIYTKLVTMAHNYWYVVVCALVLAALWKLKDWSLLEWWKQRA